MVKNDRKKRATALYYGAFVLLLPLYFAWHTYARLHDGLSSRPRLGAAMPTFRLQQLDGSDVQLNRVLAKRRSVVVFVKVGCPTCRRTLALLQKNPRVASGDVQIVAIAQETPAEAAKLRSEIGFTGVVLSDPDKSFYSRAGGLTVPLTYLVDEHGRIRGLIEGAKTEESFAASIAPLFEARL